MPVTFDIDHPRRFVRARAEGLIGIKDIDAFLDAVVIENAMPYRKLFDARGSIGRYDANDMAVLAARINTLRYIDRRGALAVVISPQHAALAERFLVLERNDRPARAFLDEEEAMRWLRAQQEA
jgi:hypothetical protein